MKRKFLDYLLPIVRVRKETQYTFYTFEIGGGEYENGFVSPSIDAPTYLELEELISHGSLIVKPAGIWLGVKPKSKPRMSLYLQPFKIVELFNRVFPIEYKPRLVEKDLDLHIPETYVFLNTPRSVFWYYQPKRVLIRNYDIQVSNDDYIQNYDIQVSDYIIFLFKELEREFLQFFEAFKEASIAH